MLKALAAQEKEVLRMRQREAQSGPRDDLDVEWQALLDAQRSSLEYVPSVTAAVVAVISNISRPHAKMSDRLLVKDVRSLVGAPENQAILRLAVPAMYKDIQLQA